MSTPTIDHLRLHFEGAPASSFIEVWRKDTSQSAYLPADNPERAAELLIGNSDLADVYFCIGASRTKKPSTQRTSIPDVGWLPGFYIDLDIFDPAKPDKFLPRSVDEAFQGLLDIDLPEPWMVIATGNGFAAHYRFDEPLTFGDDGAARAGSDRISKLSASIRDRLKAQRGWMLDNVGQANRLTRPAGTFNRKSAPAKRVTIYRQSPGERVTLTELETKFTFQPKPQTSSIIVPKKLSVENSPSGDFNVECIETHCAWAKSAIDRSSSLSEPEWYALASFYRDSWEAEARFHEISSVYPGYSRSETAAKLAHAREASGPRTCASIAQDFGSSSCALCPFRGQIKSPAALGFADPDLLKLQCRYVFESSSRTYIDLETGNRFDPPGFSDKWMHESPEPVHDRLRRSKLTIKADREDYVPGDPRRIIRQPMELICNTYRAGGVVPMAGDWSILRTHFELLIPDEAARERFFDRMASVVQRPESKIRSAYLLSAEQGTGKNSVAKIFELLVGEANVRFIPGDAIGARFNADLAGCLVLVIEELKAFSKPEAYELLKPFLSEDRARVEQKYKDARMVATPREVLAFSNHERPIHLDPGDRRFEVYASPMTPQDAAYYERLYSEGFAQAPAFKHWLLTRDLSSFNASAPPPVSEAKKALLSVSRSPLEKAIESMIEELVPPFDQPFFTLSDVRAALTARRLVGIGDDHQIASMLRKHGAEKLGQKSRDGVRQYLWTSRPEIAAVALAGGDWRAVADAK